MYNFSYVHYNCDEYEFCKCARIADGVLSECVVIRHCAAATLRFFFLYGNGSIQVYS